MCLIRLQIQIFIVRLENPSEHEEETHSLIADQK